MSDKPQARLLRGNDAMNALIDVYLNGMASGAASAAGHLVDVTDAECDDFARKMVALVRADPIGIESVRREIAETLTGVDSGPYSLTVGEWGKP